MRLAVDDEVDIALAVQRHVLGAVFRHACEPEHLEHRLQHTRCGGREFDELESHQAHRVFKQIGHIFSPLPVKTCVEES